jgi:diguanylate cyclase (GGDEF)-like protein/PAS domain S-box-containing protein
MEFLLWCLVGISIIGGGERIIHHFREKRKLKQLAEQNEQQFTALFNQTAFGVIALSRAGEFDRANRVFLSSLGYEESDVIGKYVGDFLHEDDMEDFAEHLQYFKDHPDANAVREKRFRKKNGEYVWMMLSCAYIPASEQIIGQTIDITDRKDAEETIYQLAYYDTLTALPNRLHFNQFSNDTLDRARKGKFRFAIFLIDLDNFKNINDTYGHHIGDALLKEIAIRLDDVIGMRCELEEHCRCFCARLGGDEFVLVIEHIRDVQDAAQVADWLYGMFQTPIQVGPHDLNVSVTTGISIYPYDGTTVSSLLRSADLALYTAKDKGKNTYLFHENEMNERFEQLFEHNNVLKYMLDTNDFELMYQPTVDISTGKVTGVEALLAGNKQKYPRLDIQNLILLAEENGMIVDLGVRILEKACREFVLNIQPHTNSNFGMAVNVSVRQLEDPQFVTKVATVIHETGMPPEHLILEITETAMATHFYDVTKKLRKLSDIGVRFAIDDFGKGYASMSHLRQLHAHKLKIDKSLVDDVNNPKGKEIVRTIILMSHALKLTCVAEGVETDEVFRTLREMECDEVQGYLISPSLLITDLKRYLALSLR